MSLFPKWRGKLRLPALPERRLRLGGNTVLQRVFLGAETDAAVFESQYKNHELIKTDLEPPFREVLLRRKGARRISTSLPVVTSLDENDQTLEWDTLGELETYANTPEKVLAAWTNKFEFRTGDESAGDSGLRIPQIGALHAISAHFAVGSDFEPATVVLPTGTGKTETMLATLVYRQLLRTLVIVPSRALREQIGDKFASLGVLPKACAVPREIARPRVAIVSTGIRTVDEARKLIEQANVIVALPDSLNASNTAAAAHLAEQCSDLVVDEAHHVTASTWAAVRDRFKDKRILQFTATPFRRDGKRVDGKIIFNYKLGDAQADGYYRSINLRTVEDYGDEASRDWTIASEAVAALKRDREELELDHLARTSSKVRAAQVFEIYKKLAPELKPVVVHSGRTSANRDAMNQLLDRGSDGSRIVVCVDMLGEGFDLPNLKVAALHDTHKSLAVTLQFIGRFTRKGPTAKIGDATVVTNIADPEAEKKLANLYAEGADWDRIIKRLSEDRVTKELRLQDVVAGLKASGDLHNQLALWNLKPSLSAQFFRTSCTDWKPLEYRSVLPQNSESWYALSDRDKILVAVVCRSRRVDWGNYQDVLDIIYDLIVLRWDKRAGLLCLHALTTTPCAPSDWLKPSLIPGHNSSPARPCSTS